MSCGNIHPSNSGARGILIYCADNHCSHSLAISADRWPDDMWLSDIEPLFVCKASFAYSQTCPHTFESLSVNSKVIIGLSRVRTFLPGSMRA